MTTAEWADTVAKADRIEVYLAGMEDGAPATAEGMITIAEPEAVQTLAERLATSDEDASASGPGHVTLRLYAGDELLDTVAIHHGEVLVGADWDHPLAVAKPPRLISWLARNGISLAGLAAARLKAQRTGKTTERQAWIDAMPSPLKGALAPHLMATEMAGSIPDRLVDEAEQELVAGLPDEQERCVALLNWHAQGTGLLVGQPTYEDIPNELLKRVPLDVVAVTLHATDATKLGAARHFGSRARTRDELRTLDPAIGETVAAAAESAGRQGIADEVRKRFRP
ncbi:hypothetical protein AADG42_01085 [Ammonicoccus fulvus]|uniref:Uncharacterized protein n=1 Tax=Ammonicoccus fulvus TaxID=3138240 RepID=A0ABZ3FMU4_9ACTN